MENSMTPIRTLDTVTSEIRYLDNQAKRLALGHAIEIGRRLTEAKSLVPRGGWGDYVANLGYSASTAQNLMRVFEEYGSSQMGMFGPEAESQALGSLPYTKALRLLAIPAEEREEFVEVHDVQNLSTRELEKAIAEAKAEKERAEQAEKDRAYAEEKLQELNKQFETSQDAIIQRDMKLQDKDAEIYDLKSKVKELESRPVEVAVERDEEAVRNAVRETEEKAREEIDRLQDTIGHFRADRERTQKELAEAKKALAEAEQKLKNADSGELETLKAEAEKAKTRADAAEVKTLFDMWKEQFRKIIESMNKLDAETAEKMLGAIRKQAEIWAKI